MLDLVSLFNDFHIDYEISQKWINVQCPHCLDKGKHGGFNINGEYYNCFRCGGHDRNYTLRKLLNVSRSTFATIAEQYSGKNSFIAKKADFIPVDSVKLPGGALKKIHIKYLKERGFDYKYLVNKYKLQGTTWLDFGWEYRIIIPIIVNGVVVAFQGRTVIDDKIRYKTSKNEESIIPAKNTLYNMDNCKGRYAVIVEGAFDAMRIGDGVVATLGTGMTQAQKELIYEKYDEVTFLFDPEYEAQKRAEEHGNDLAALGVTVNICNMEWEHDPGSLTEEEIKKVRNLLKIY